MKKFLKNLRIAGLFVGIVILIVLGLSGLIVFGDWLNNTQPAWVALTYLIGVSWVVLTLFVTWIITE